MRAIVASLVLAACGSRATPPPEPPSNAHGAAGAAGATCADSLIDATRAIDGPASYAVSSGERINREIRSHAPLFKLCYLQRLKNLPDLGGRVTARFTVQKSGRAVNIQTFGFDAEIDQCICERLSAIDFGALDRAETIEYPFLFSPGA